MALFQGSVKYPVIVTGLYNHKAVILMVEEIFVPPLRHISPSIKICYTIDRTLKKYGCKFQSDYHHSCSMSVCYELQNQTYNEC